MVDRTGQQLGSYRLIRLLGHGGFAEVYLGEHVRLNSYAAVKVLNMQLGGSDAESFQREAHTIARLLHPHIIRVFDYDVAEGTPFLVMDYAPNGTLRSRHPKGARVPVANIVSYVKQVAEALQYAHSQKVIHRDIKPENMLLGRNDEVLLSDFGIATATQSSRYQHTQEIVGTVAYMAPEQIQGKPHPASDQYGLGIVVYEWLSGERPFNGSFTEVAIQQVVAPPQPLREKVPGIPQQIEQVIMIALAKDLHQRFGSITAFANALEQACKTQPSSSAAPASMPPAPIGFVPPPPVLEAPMTTGPTIQAFEGEYNAINTPIFQDPSTPRPVSSSTSITPPSQDRRTVSRRAMLIGLAGLVVVGGTAAGFALANHLGASGGTVTTPVPGSPTTVKPSPTGAASTPTPTVAPFSGTWSSLPSLLAPEADNVAIHIRLQQHDYIYMTGGNRGSTFTPPNDDALYRYDTAAMQWEIAMSTFPGMFNNSVVQDEHNTLFFTGGYSPDNQAIATLLYKYQPATGNVQTITPPASITFGYGGSMIADQQGHLFLTQGYMHGFGTHTSAGTGWYRYDIAQNQWATLAPLPVGVGYTVLAPDGHGGLVLLGGVTDTEQKNGSTAIYRYRMASNSWTTEQMTAPANINGSASCDLGNGRVVVVGGYDPTNNIVLDTAWFIDLNTLHATQLASIPGGTRLGTAAYDGAGNVYVVVGAKNGPEVPTADFWRLSLQL
ncbi:MAG TPA: protein kinase [Ktedonobacteraceae bacterium]|nr:protein kinase [Ktedonobacteraceae bacterium]